MARSNDRERSSRRPPKDNGRRTKKKVCIFCRDGADYVDYKDVNLLRKFMSDRGKIRARRVSGNCAQHQRAVARAIKTTRELALLPYTQRTTSERPGGRGGRGGRSGPGRSIPPAVPDAALPGEADDEATLEDLEIEGEDTGDGAEEEPVASEAVSE
jgi:small subunit ribosomal protein S18